MSGSLGKSYKIIWQQISSRASVSFLRCQRFSQQLLSLFAVLSPSSAGAGECGGQAIYCMCPSFSGKTKSLSGMESPEFGPKALAGGAAALAAAGGHLLHRPGSRAQPEPGRPLRQLWPAMPSGTPSLGPSPPATSRCARTRRSPAPPGELQAGR